MCAAHTLWMHSDLDLPVSSATLSHRSAGGRDRVVPSADSNAFCAVVCQLSPILRHAGQGRRSEGSLSLVGETKQGERLVWAWPGRGVDRRTRPGEVLERSALAEVWSRSARGACPGRLPWRCPGAGAACLRSLVCPTPASRRCALLLSSADGDAVAKGGGLDSTRCGIGGGRRGRARRELNEGAFRRR